MMKPFCLICMCLFAPFSIEAQEKKGYLSQCIALEKQIFSESGFNERDSLLLLKSQLYKQNSDFENALKTIDRISNLANSGITNRVIDEKIKLNYLMGNHQQVKNLVIETDFIANYKKSMEVILFESLNHLALQEPNLARESFKLLISEEEIVNETFENVKFKNPSKAFILSFIIPGSGQMYAGKFFKGLLSLGLQAPLFYVGVNGISRGYIFTESIPSIALFQGFYFGGAEYAKKIAQERNQETIEEVSLNMLEAIKKEASL